MKNALHVIADRGVFGESARYLSVVRRVADALPAQAVLQLRIKTGERELVARACDQASRSAATVVINANMALDDALAFGAHGVHWPEKAIPAIRPEPRARCLTGASVHDLGSLRKAENAVARYVIYGPVFDAGSSNKHGVGVAALRAIVRSTRLPVIAIGGASPARVAPCLDAGAAGIAVLSAVMLAAHPEVAVDRFVEVLAHGAS